VGSLIRSVPRWARIAVIAAVALAAIVAAAAASLRDRSDAPVALLPDLQQRAPFALSGSNVRTGRGIRFRLGFGSAVDNVGVGPLLVVGRREGSRTATMRASQLVRHSDGSMRTYAGVGRLRYTRSTDHQHWHLLRFDRYELRTRTGSLARDRKTGFCLGDRYESDITVTLEGEPPGPVWTEECGRDEPRLSTVREGISVGYGDNYFPHLEGQYIDITGVPAGRYELVHRANGDRALRESDYQNNAASIIIRIRWPDGMKRPPRIDVLRRCGHGVRCPFTG
jgi:hypothetical protein